MSPLRWIHSTGPHWTVILTVYVSISWNDEGAAEGAAEEEGLVHIYPTKQAPTPIMAPQADRRHVMPREATFSPYIKWE